MGALASVSYSAERNRSNAQIRRNVMLGNPLHDLRMLHKQFFVALLRIVFKEGIKKLLRLNKATEQTLLQYLF